MSLRLSFLDPWVLRDPFEGRTAARYAAQRRGFADLDERLVNRVRGELPAGAVFLDVGAGAGELARRVAAACPGVTVVAVEPSAALSARAAAGAGAGAGAGAPIGVARAVGEALPVRDGCVDVAVCLSSLRHVRDRDAALRELRRAVRPGGAAYVVELDPEAGRGRRERHARAMTSAVARAVFSWWVLPTCPPASAFERAARRAGWRDVEVARDPVQPVYVMRLA